MLTRRICQHEQGVFNVVALEKASVDIYTHVYD